MLRARTLCGHFGGDAACDPGEAAAVVETIGDLLSRVSSSSGSVWTMAASAAGGGACHRSRRGQRRWSRPGRSWPARAGCGRRGRRGGERPQRCAAAAFRRAQRTPCGGHLEPEEPAADGEGPEEKEEADQARSVGRLVGEWSLRGRCMLRLQIGLRT